MSKVKKSKKNVKSNDVKVLKNLLKKTVKTFETRFKKLEDIIIDGRSSKDENKVEEEATTSKQFNSKQNVVYNISNITIEKPKFGGAEKTHPVTFIEDLENYFKKVPSNGIEVDIARECLREEAKHWARINSVNWTKFEDFKLNFLQVFWGEDEQNKVRRFLVQNKWNKQIYPTMVGYFLYVVEKVQMLTYAIPEKQLLADVLRHYPKNVQQLWRIAKIDTIIDTTEFLRHLDDIEKQDENRDYYTKERQQKFDFNYRKNQKDIQQSYKKWRKPDEVKKVDGQVNEVQVVHDGSSNQNLVNPGLN